MLIEALKRCAELLISFKTLASDSQSLHGYVMGMIFAAQKVKSASIAMSIFAVQLR